VNRSMDLFLFGILPYVAVAVAVVGSAWRIQSAPLTWRTGSSQLLESRWLRVGSILFHFGMVNLLLGHVFGLLTPHHVYEAFGLTTPLKQRIEIVMGFIMAPAVFAGGAILIWRRLVDERVKASSSWGDIPLLAALLAEVALGALTIPQSMQHLDGSMMLVLTGYVQGLVILDTSAWRALVDVPWIYKAHMAVGFLFILVLPFTKLVHVLSGLLVVRYLLRPWQVVRKGSWSRR